MNLLFSKERTLCFIFASLSILETLLCLETDLTVICLFIVHDNIVLSYLHWTWEYGDEM